jgi:hypothetical protein
MLHQEVTAHSPTKLRYVHTFRDGIERTSVSRIDLSKQLGPKKCRTRQAAPYAVPQPRLVRSHRIGLRGGVRAAAITALLVAPSQCFAQHRYEAQAL